MKHYIHILLFLLLPLMATAQTDPAAVDTSLTRTHGMTGFSPFNPAAYQVQKRWRPTEGDTAFQQPWWRHLTLGVSTGVDFMTNWHYNTRQLPLQAFLGYNITPIHQLRVQVGTEEMEVQGQSDRIGSLSGELQYLANLNAFTSGYEPNRPLQFSTLLSIGAKRYSTPIPYRITPFARVGFDVAAHIGPNLSIFAQPYVGAIRNTRGAFTGYDPAHYKVIYGVHAGLAAHLNDGHQFYADKAPIYRSAFFETGVGMGFETRAFNTHQGGMNAWVGLGRWFDPAFGLRVGVMGQQNYWDRAPYETSAPSYTMNKAHDAAAIRGELLVNLLNLGRNHNRVEDPTWELNLSAGAQYGHNARTDEPRQASTWRCNFYGFTGALQALYKVSPGSYLYVEPRFYNNIYNKSYVHAVGDNPITTDRFMTFNAGVRVYAAPRSVRQFNDNQFTPHWWTGLGMGGMRIFQHYRVQEKGYGALQPTFSFNVGYDAHPLASLRLQSEWQMLKRNTGNLNTNYQLLDFRLMYMLPFTNLVRGVDSHNKLQTYIQIGPTISSYVGQHTSYGPGELGNGPAPVYRVGQHSLGGMVGIMAAYKVAPRWDIYIESQGQYNLSDNFTAGNNRRPGHLKYGLYGGMRYHFLPHGEEERARLALDVPEWQQGWFVEGSTGWAFPMRGSHNDIRQDGTALHRSGSLFNVNFGRMFMPWLGARIGVAAQQNSGHTSKAVIGGRDFTGYAAMASASMTFEALVDPLCFSRTIRQQDNRWFDINLSAGFTGGALYSSVSEDHRGRTKFVGFVSTMQTLFRVAPSVWVYAEPRFVTHHYDPYKLGAENYVYPRAALRSMAISGGVRIVRPGKPTFDKGGILDDYSTLRGIDSEAPLLAYDGISTAFQPHWWLGVQAGGTKDVNKNKWVSGDRHIAIQPTMSLNAGYDFHPLATLRAQMEYTRLGNLDLSNNMEEHHDDMLNMRLLYMLNMTNLWRGTRQWTRFSMYPEVGIAFGHHNASYKGKREAFGVVAGAMAALRLTPQLDLTVETIEQYNWPHGYMPAQDHPKMANGTWSLSVGSRYHILRDREDRIAADAEIPAWQRGWFFDFGTGWALPVGKNTDPEGNSGGSMLERSGSLYNLSFGRWLTPWLGARAGLMAQQHYGPTRTESMTMPGGLTREYTMNEAQAFAGMTFEVLTSPLNYSRRLREMDNRWFDLNLAVGPYWGAVAREMPGGSHHREKMLGFTGSMQALFRVTDGTQLYIEPRYMATRYSNRDIASAVKPYSADRNFNISLGVRVTRPDYATRLAEAEANAKSLHDEAVPNVFRPHLWLGLGIGGIKDVDSHKMLPRTGLSINPAASVSLGYDIHPLATLRTQLEYAQLSRMNGNLKAAHSNTYDLRFLYMLNATNLWRGTRIWPRFSVLPEAGVAFSHHDKVEGYASNTAALVGGTMVAWRATRIWDLTAETQVQYALNANFMPWQETATRGGRGKWGISLGTRYHFGEHMMGTTLNTYTPSWMKGWFLEGGYGWNMPVYSGKDALALSGSSWNVHFGHWFSSTLGFRVGITATQGYWDEHHTNAVMKGGESIHGAYDTKYASITTGSRIELMTNPLNFFHSMRHRTTPSRFDLNLSAGFELGRLSHTHTSEGRMIRQYTGFTAASEVLYRVAPGMQIFLEPRYHGVRYAMPKNAFGIKEKTTDHYMTLAVGARLQRPEASRRSDVKSGTDSYIYGHGGSELNTPFQPHWFFGVNVSGVKQLHCAHVKTGGIGWQPGFGLNLGYVAHPLATLRLQLQIDANNILNLHDDYQTQVSLKKWETHTAAMTDKLTQLNARAIYMLDFTNLWRGTRQQPRLSAYWEVGPTISTIIGQTKTFMEGEKVPNQQMATGTNYKGRSSAGFMTGVLCAIRLTPQWDLTFESMGQYNFKRNFLPSNCRVRLGNTQMEFGIGTRYNF